MNFESCFCWYIIRQPVQLSNMNQSGHLIYNVYICTPHLSLCIHTNTPAPCPGFPNLRTRDSPILVPNYDFEEFRAENQAKTRVQNLVFWNTSFGFLYGIPRYFRGNAMKFALISLSSVIMYWVSVTLPLVSLSHYTLSSYYIIYCE